MGMHGGGDPNSQVGGAGGGGATDISLHGKKKSTEWDTPNHFLSRIIVAGGGGGSCHTRYPNWVGGNGGGSDGGRNNEGTVNGAGQSNGYKFGVAQNNVNNHNSGGGGGWYGGFAYSRDGWGRSGGGGSGYVYNQNTESYYPSGCKLNKDFYLSDSSTIQGSSGFPNIEGNGTEMGHSGHGYAKITKL